MIKRIILIGLLVMTGTFSFAQNPLITNIYTADPAPHVWPTDTTTLYVYSSHDEPLSNSHIRGMNDYHVFSTNDLVHWTDHGQILHWNRVPWAVDQAWAIDAVYWKGKYYLITCMRGEDQKFRTGVAVSERPQGPFTDCGYIRDADFGQDPAVYVENGKAYLFWGHDRTCFGAELNDDLLSIKKETLVNLRPQLPHVFEAPWVIKRNGRYLLMYPGLPDRGWPQKYYYAEAEKPLGPYEYKGIFIDDWEGQSSTTHGGIVRFKGKDIMFYHGSILSGGLSESRSIMADWVDYDKDGSIKLIRPTKKGLGLAERTWTTVHLEAEEGNLLGGELHGVYVDNSYKGYTGRGYVTGFDMYNDYCSFLGQSAKDEKYRLRIRYRADAGKNDAMVFVNTWLLKNVKFVDTEGEWKVLDCGNVSLRAGNNDIRVIRGWWPNTGLCIDYIELAQIDERGRTVEEAK